MAELNNASGAAADSVVQNLIDGAIAIELSIAAATRSPTESASEALSMQFQFITYTTEITASSQIIKTLGEAMNATVHNIS